MRKYLTEFIGTFFLVFTIVLAAPRDPAAAPLAIGSILMCMIYMGGHVSGAHYNPAVTLAVYIRGRLAVREIVPYMIAQVVGALLAALIAFSIVNQTFAPRPSTSFDWLGALLAEIIFTFALALVVLNVATSKDHPNNSFYGLAIGFTVLAGAIAVGPISGGAFNPAVGIGMTVVDSIVQMTRSDQAQTLSLTTLWLYLVGPFLGAALAAYVFQIQNPDDK
jgi:aquaporin Z